MNKAESEALELGFRERGWGPAGSAEEADLVLLNTCSVRRTAESRIWGRLGALKEARRNGRFRLAVMGCMSERLKEEMLERAPHVDILVGNFQKSTFVDFLEEYLAGEEGGPPAPGAEGGAAPAGRRLLLTGGGEYEFGRAHSVGGFQAFVPIMHGCDNFCSYCIVPHVRGREVSRSPGSILAELADLDGRGVREVTLLGQNVNSYRFAGAGEEGPLDFPALLRRVTAALGARGAGIEWVRFLTSHPRDFSDGLIEVLAAGPLLCRHIHLPVQHGSDRVLQAMGRGYTRAAYLALVERIRSRIRDVSLTTDILIGFPGEEEEDFRLTLELMREAAFEDAFTYRYNPREGTRAFDWGDTVPEADKQRRLQEVIGLQRELTRAAKRRKVGSRVRALVEGVSRRSEGELLARTESDEMVVFPAERERIGGFCRLELTGLRGNTFRGKEAG